MATNLVIAYNNYLSVAGVTATADQANANFPAANVLTDQRQLVWRTTDALTGHNIVFDLGSAKTVGYSGMWDLNIEDGASAISVKGADDAAITVNVLASTATGLRNMTTAGSTSHKRNRFNLHKVSIGTKRYWQVLVATPAVPVIDSYTTFGKCWIGAAPYTLTKNYSTGIRYALQDMTQARRTPNGAVNINRRLAPWIVTFDVPRVTRTEMESLRTIFDTVGAHSPVIIEFEEDFDVARHTLYGRFTRQADRVLRGNNLWDLTFDFEELV